MLLALMFVMTGAMKLLVPSLRDAFAGQLEAAGLPLQWLTRLVVPYVEIALGILLALGALTRLVVAGILLLMAGATYVHLVVHDSSLFPLQPSLPIIPIVVIAMCLYLLWRSGSRHARPGRRTVETPDYSCFSLSPYCLLISS
jgi:uncharacterized membrane protein YphA (DoxX/SURF4 family)